MLDHVSDHQPHVPAHEVERHVDRRGRAHAYDTLDSARTALVVVDLVDFFVDLGDDRPEAADLLAVVNTLGAELRPRGGTIAWVTPAVAAATGWARGFYGDQVAERYAASGGADEPARRLHRALDVRREDVVVEKSAPSAFFPGRCDLDDRLRERGVDTVVVCGAVAEVCVESTVRDAATLGYRTVVVADALVSVSEETTAAMLRVVYRSFGDVRSADEVIGLLEPHQGR